MNKEALETQSTQPGEIRILCLDEFYGRCPVPLLESGATEHARMAYVALTSFGREAWAGREAIRRRMGVRSLTTVKEALRELQALGWIEKKADGGGRATVTWQIHGRAFGGQQDLPLDGDRGATRPGAPHAPVAIRPGAPGAPQRGAERPLNKKLSKNLVLVDPQGGIEEHAQERAWMDSFWELHKAAHGQPPAPPWTDHLRKRMREITKALGSEEIQRRARLYFAAPGGHALEDFVRNIDRWSAGRSAGGQGRPTPSGRAFHPAAGSDWRPSDDH